jgi:hypothetical protein
MISGTAPKLHHLPTGNITKPSGPAANEWFPYRGWLPDGRLILAGKDGEPASESLTYHVNTEDRR